MAGHSQKSHCISMPDRQSEDLKCWHRRGRHSLGALVVLPTRELAVQVPRIFQLLMKLITSGAAIVLLVCKLADCNCAGL